MTLDTLWEATTFSSYKTWEYCDLEQRKSNSGGGSGGGGCNITVRKLDQPTNQPMHRRLQRLMARTHEGSARREEVGVLLTNQKTKKPINQHVDKVKS